MKKMLTVSWPIFWPFIIENPLRFEHNSHHVKIGDPGHDYEVAGFALFIRYSGRIKHRFLHNYQHKMAAVLYLFYANIITTIGGIQSGFWNKHNRSNHTEQKFSLFATFLYFIIIPVIVNQSLLWYVLLYLVYQCTLYFGIYVGAAINHFVPSVTKKIPIEHENKFGYYVCHNTTNFCSTNPFWIWYTGGFNIQIEHHLIPFIPVENLTKMISIVRELCEKYGYPYKDYPSIKALWDDHYAYLQMMSESSPGESILSEIMNKQVYQAR
jgi:fatty acid desaturase